LDGNGQKLIVLDTRVERSWLNVDEAGNAFVLRQTRAGGTNNILESLLSYDAAGCAKDPVAIAQPNEERLILNGLFFGMSLKGQLYLQNADGAATSLNWQPNHRTPASFQLAPISGNRILLLNRQQPTGYIADVETGTTKPVAYSSPEIVDFERRYGSASTTVLVNDAASDGHGNVYITLSGIRLAKGAVILRLDGDARINQSLRCLLPKSDKYRMAGNPDGYMAPSLIQVAGKTLFILDRKGTVAAYPLP
jgi:hypothetical protein